jgi:hypothetical protein
MDSSSAKRYAPSMRGSLPSFYGSFKTAGERLVGGLVRIW